MNKKLIILSLAILSIAGTTFAATVGTTSNSTVEGPAFYDVFAVVPSETIVDTGEQESTVIKLTTTADHARGWGLLLDNTQSAIDFMFANDLTRFGSVDNYMGSTTLRRDQAATFYARFAAKALGMVPDTTRAGCSFSDMNAVDANLKDDVVIACQMGLFKGYAGKFLPEDRFTVGQALTVLIRIIDGYKSEVSSIHRAHNYRQAAYAMGLTDTNALQLDNQIQRADVAKLIEAGAIVEQVKSMAKATGYAAVVFQNTASTYGGKIMMLSDNDANVSLADKKTVIGGLGSISSRYWIDLN